MSIAQHLNRMLEADLSAQDEALGDPDALTNEARTAMAAGQLGRALRLIQRALEITPDHEGRAATAVSLLRKAKRPDDALPILARFRQTSYVPLLVTGAAVLCDVERWEDALKVIRRALARGESGEAFAVYQRIRKNRPDLFDG
jgi:tetratricopeptide (TPR) repeat protein